MDCAVVPAAVISGFIFSMRAKPVDVGIPDTFAFREGIAGPRSKPAPKIDGPSASDAFCEPVGAICVKESHQFICIPLGRSANQRFGGEPAGFSLPFICKYG